MLDGEIVIATEHGLDFDRLQMRIHPAASRVAKLAAETPSSFVAFDLLAEGDDDLRPHPFCGAAPAPRAHAAPGQATDPPHPRDRRPEDRRATGSSSSRAPVSTA